jgi:hypothetical protein
MCLVIEEFNIDTSNINWEVPTLTERVEIAGLEAS